MPVRDDELAQQFRTTYTALVERAPDAPSFDEITSRLPDPSANGRRSKDAAPHGDLSVFDLQRDVNAPRTAPSKRSAGVALAVAAVILLIVGIVVADRDSDSVVTDAASTPMPAEPPALPPAAEPGTPRWPLLPFEGGAGFLGVAGGVWTSVDGLSWSAVEDEAVFGGEGVAMVDVTVGGPGLVAVGHQSVCTDLPVLDEDGSIRVDEVGVPEPLGVCSDRNAVVWTSADGLKWSRVPHDEAVFGGADFYQMTGVIAGGPGLVAVGWSEDFGGGAVNVAGESVVDVNAVVWTSADGLTWSRVPHDEAVFGGPDWQSMHAVTVGGPGLVAVGQDGGRHWWGNSPADRPGVWTSLDGLTWTKAPDDQDAFGINSTMLGVTAGGPGLVAVGHGGGDVARVWTSTDGLSWSQVTHENASDMHGFMWDVTVGGPGLLAVGCCEDPAQVWTSPDGLTWSRDPNVTVPEPGP